MCFPLTLKEPHVTQLAKLHIEPVEDVTVDEQEENVKGKDCIPQGLIA